MTKIEGTDRKLDVLINCKTYPAVSKKYIETVCTGGIAEDGTFARLYPIPFRFLEENEQYKRWDIVRISVYKDTKDPRPESWHLKIGDQINVIGKAKTDESKWAWMKNGIFESTQAMEQQKLTNGLVEIVPEEIHWEREAKKWTPNQLEVLTQGNLFHDEAKMQSLSDRVPWQFKLRFIEKNTGDSHSRKILAWSYYQAYRRFFQQTQSESRSLEMVRDRIYQSIFASDRTIFGIFGTHSRFGHWMISALYHVPTEICRQERLF